MYKTIIHHNQPLRGQYSDILYGDGDWAKFYEDKFRARRGVMLHALNRGWTFEDCRREMLNHANPGSELWTRSGMGTLHNAAKQIKIIKDDYKACMAKIVSSPAIYSASDARQRIGEIIAAAKSYEWSKRSGKTDRDVLLFICKRMTELGSTKINLSGREIALGAGVVQETARVSLERLSRDAWLSWLPPGQPGHAGEVSLKVKSQNQSYDSLYGRDSMTSFETLSETDPSHETWVRLGKSAKAIYSHLADYPRTAEDLASLAVVGRSTAFKVIPKQLVSNGLAVKVAGGYVIGPLTPDDVAVANTWVEDNSKVQQRTELYAELSRMHQEKLEVYKKLAHHTRLEVAPPSQQLMPRSDQIRQSGVTLTDQAELTDLARKMEAYMNEKIYLKYPPLRPHERELTNEQ